MVEVNVSKDGMLAEVSVCPEPEEELTAELVENTLRLEGVQAGIDKAAIAAMLENKTYNEMIPVAKGKTPVNGADGYYEYFFELPEKSGRPAVRKDGSVDYAFKIVNVDEGELLAEYHPETAGTFGYNVFSKMLTPVRGKGLPPLRCQDVRLEDNKYYAERGGHVTLSGDTLSIQNVLEIEGDTAYSDGDIVFNGNVRVSGNICNGVTVRVTGSVMVDGVIENASVYAGLDVVVSQGIHGQGILKEQGGPGQSEAVTIVETKGQLKSKFVDHAFVKAAGDILIDYAIGSVITSEGKVTACGSRGAIIGGSVEGRMGVDAEVLGNNAELPTEIRVEGIAPIIARKAIYPNVRMHFGKVTVPDCAGRSNVEFRKIKGRVLCRAIGAFKESELVSVVVSRKPEPAKKLVILVIDDDIRLLRMVHGVLEHDYQVAVATSGKIGRKFLEKSSADLILLDYMMPDENGVEVLKSLRANENTKDIPVSFLTGLDDKKKILECLSLHPAGYIVKPVNQEKLLAKIHAILGDKTE